MPLNKRRTISNPSHLPNEDHTEEDIWSRPNWPPQLEKVLVELLVEQTKLCDEEWEHVTRKFNNKTGLNYDKLELQDQLALLQKRYQILKPFYHVWQHYSEAHPEIKPYEKWGCPIFDELYTIFTDRAFSAADLRSHSSHANSRSNKNANHLKRCKNSESIGKSTERVHATEDVKGCMPRKSSQLSSGETKMPESYNPYSVSHCVTVMNRMQGLDRGLYFAAIDLFENARWRKIFMSLKTEKRLAWLKAMDPSVS
ncbi:uncharacterized protein LOC126677576 [Mercurialis annua]|uniref:uncharacterized protein LOC126677576 n=1 Tax=Mercurialis annua TaxID=3986 RepID=UPI00215EA5C5|nr:uncharacterized protein LOC126677576 [Mercurialis annua]